MRHKSDAAEIFKRFLADTRADGVPSKVVIVRSDGAGEFCGGKFGDLCRSQGVKQEFTTAGSPQVNGVAKRALGLIETAAMEDRIQLVSFFVDRNYWQRSHYGLKRRTGRAMF